MKKIILSLILISLVCLGCTVKQNEEETVQTDALKFKEEYEAYNDKINEENGKNYKNLDIAEDNPMIYATFDQIMSILDTSGIIYFGFETCPWCRTAVPVILEAAAAENIGQIYYFNALSLRDVKKLDENGNIVTEQEGDPQYYELLDKIGDIAEVYDGLNDDTIKRLYFPTVVVVKDGEIIFYHTSTVDSQTDPYEALTTEQHDELYQLYAEAFAQVVNACQISKC
ncbi:MAG: hypothetical protein VB012_03170 [Erysipelotrichaceae bacterium]|nr:hypothetical protein [Erysipelotrichaceae bacterium]